jgi:GNAT superfamily N-acetyltransferase
MPTAAEPERMAELERLHRLADRIRKRGRFNIRGARMEEVDREAERVWVLLNRALAHLTDFTPWPRETVDALIEPFKQLADPELILFAEADGEAVGWFPGIADLNEVFKRVNGLRHFWNYPLFAWLMRNRRPKTQGLSVKSVLVLPEYWNTGVAVLLFDEMARRAAARGYRWIDLSITSEDNPATPVLATRMGARLYKRWRVYHKGV